LKLIHFTLLKFNIAIENPKEISKMENCIFCNNIYPEQKIKETENFFMIFDINPIQKGHLLIISKNHYANIYDLPREKLHELIDLEKSIIKIIENNFEVLGVTSIKNNGHSMMEGTHFHTHIIPRYIKDDFWTNQKVKQHSLDSHSLGSLLNNV